MHLCLFQSSFAHFILGSIFTDVFLIKLYKLLCLLSLTLADSCLLSSVLFLKSCPCFCSLIMSTLGSSASTVTYLPVGSPSGILQLLSMIVPLVICVCILSLVGEITLRQHQLNFCLCAEDFSLLLCTPNISSL